jgi:hypothetical protein
VDSVEWKNASPEVKPGMIDFATVKLTGLLGIGAMSNIANIAALSTRLHFEFEPSKTAAVSLEDELVERNMRIAFRHLHTVNISVLVHRPSPF